MEEKLHIIPHHHDVSKLDRNRLAGHNSVAIWFTGLSGSGKSTIASALERALLEKGVSTFILDGDNIRAGLNKDLSFSDQDRVENIRRIGEVCNLFVEAGTVVLCAFVSPFKKDRQLVKDLVGTDKFIEVFIDCPLEICEQRDVKGLYKKARQGEISNFTGISSPFESPSNPDIRIPSHKINVEESVDKILNTIKSKLVVDEEGI